MYGNHLEDSMDQPGKVANPVRGQLTRNNFFSLSPFAPEKLVSRERFDRPVPRQPAHSPQRLNLVLTNGIHPFIYLYR